MDDTTRLFDLFIKVLDGISEVKANIADVKAKMDSFSTMHTELKDKVEKLEVRICKLEQAPGKTWTALKTAIIAAIGTLIGSGIAVAIVSSIKH